MTVTVTAKNSGGSTMATSLPVGPITAPAADTTPPSQPGIPAATVVSSNEIDLSWGASTDNVGVTNYQVERCLASNCTFAQIAAPTGASYMDVGLNPATSYTYRVRAIDAQGNLSPYSNTVTTATLAGGPPPACPNGYVGITFDDGPTSMSQQYVNALNAGGAHATFFNIGNQMQSYPNASAMELANGNIIGDHTMDHASYTGQSDPSGPLTDAQETAEVQGQAQIAKSQTGYTETLVRPPYGDMNQQGFNLLTGLGFTDTMWTGDTNDWQNPTTSTIVSRFLGFARDQAVILQHDGYTNTFNAIPQELAGLKSMGLCSGKIVPDPTNSNNQYDYNGLPMNWKVVAWPN
jgi:peptidoglycan/xylan/chitin deacetylase (PgdA/CDA1 family)